MLWAWCELRTLRCTAAKRSGSPRRRAASCSQPCLLSPSALPYANRPPPRPNTHAPQDVHAYAYLARKALNSYHSRLKGVVWDNAFVLQVRRKRRPAKARPLAAARSGSRSAAPRAATGAACQGLAARTLLARPPLATIQPSNHPGPCIPTPQGNAVDELPEQVLGCGRIYRTDFEEARPLSDFAASGPASGVHSGVHSRAPSAFLDGGAAGAGGSRSASPAGTAGGGGGGAVPGTASAAGATAAGLAAAAELAAVAEEAGLKAAPAAVVAQAGA